MELCTLAGLVLCGVSRANPIDASRAGAPVVPGFNLFATNMADESALAKGGLLLLAELNCTTCHAAPDEWSEQLAPVPPRSLVGVGSRMNAETLRKFVGDPQQHKGGTKMPAMFLPDDSAKVASVVDYLASLKEQVPASPVGDVARGRSLYHSAGCVACHAPAADVKPTNLPPGQEFVAPKNDSVPLTLAGNYDAASLADFLRDPLRHRPGGRMPNLHLSAQEAADIAAYFLDGKSTPRPDAGAASAADKIEKGRLQFVESGCSACHDVGEKPPPPAVKPLAKLAATGGCLSKPRALGVPFFGLGETQARALQAAIRSVQSGAQAWSAREKVAWQFARLNCYACHSRDGVGGPEPGRAAYFGVNDSTTEALGEMARIPPKLDRTGRKLTHEWFGKILWGTDGGVRPYMNTRMPDFGRAQTEPLIALLEDADKLEKPVEIDVTGTKSHHRAELGRKLLGVGGLACVSCHGLKDRKALGPPVIRLTHTVERLRPEYFKELLLNPQVTQPGTVMPPLLVGRKTADKDIESMWTYLKELGAHPMPEGLASEGDFELKPAGRPIVFRSFIEGAGTHAIGVGFPQGLNAAFDAGACRWTVIWKGRFLDAFSNFQDRPMKPIKPLGTDVKALPAEPAVRDFHGYRLDSAGVPTMLYTENGAEIEDTLRPSADGKSLERIVRANKLETKETLSW